MIQPSAFQPPRQANSSISEGSSALIAGGYSFRPPLETAARVALGPEGKENSQMSTRQQPATYSTGGLSSSVVSQPNGLYNISPPTYASSVSPGSAMGSSPVPQTSRLVPSTMKSTFAGGSFGPSSYRMPSAMTSRPVSSNMMTGAHTMSGSHAMGSGMMMSTSSFNPNQSVSISQTRGGAVQAPPGSYFAEKSGFYPSVIPEEYYSFHLEETEQPAVTKSVSANTKKTEMMMSHMPHHSHTVTNIGALDQTIYLTGDQPKPVGTKTKLHDMSHYTTSLATGQLTYFNQQDEEKKKTTTKKPLKRESRTPSQVKKSQAGCCDEFCGISSSPKESKSRSQKTH